MDQYIFSCHCTPVLETAPSSQGRHPATVLVLERRNVSAHLPAGAPMSLPGKLLFAAGQTLALTHCAEHCAAEKESTQEGPVLRRLEPLGLHLLQVLTQVLPVAFHHWGETRVIIGLCLSRQSCPGGGPGPAAPQPHCPSNTAAWPSNPPWKCFHSLDPAAGAYSV